MARISNHDLMAWRRSAERMSDLDKRFLKPLYAGLKQLTPDEIEFLMQKYYYPKEPYTDKQMAEKLGLTVSGYGNKRRKIEARLVIKHIELENIVFKEPVYNIFGT